MIKCLAELSLITISSDKETRAHREVIATSLPPFRHCAGATSFSESLFSASFVIEETKEAEERDPGNEVGAGVKQFKVVIAGFKVVRSFNCLSKVLESVVLVGFHCTLVF